MDEILSFIIQLLPGIISIMIIKRMLLIEKVTNFEYSIFGLFLSIISVLLYSFKFQLPVDIVDPVSFSKLMLGLISISFIVGLLGSYVIKKMDGLLEKIRLILNSNDRITEHRESVLDMVVGSQTYAIITTKDGTKYYGRIELCGELIDKKHRTAVYLKEPQILDYELKNKDNPKPQKMKDKKICGVVIPEADGVLIPEEEIRNIFIINSKSSDSVLSR